MAVFALRGFHAAKLDEVAERAEFGKATLYSYFETKEALFQAVLESVFEELLKRATEAFSARGTFAERLNAYVAGETAYFFESPEGHYLMMSESHLLRGENPLLQLTPKYTAILQAAIEREQRAKRIRRDLDPLTLAIALRSLVFAHFLGRIRHIMQDQRAADEAFVDEHFIEINKRIKSADIEEEIERATAFVATVFLEGVS